MSLNKLHVSEIFASLQGEGITMGSPSIFLRLGGCNLLCRGSWVCDTIPVWSKSTPFTFQELLDKMNKDFDFENRIAQGWHFIITGGEPLLQQEAIAEFLRFLMNDTVAEGCFPYTEVETNGTIFPNAKLQQLVDQWNVSPKLGNSGEKYEHRVIPTALNYFIENHKSIFKFVVSHAVNWNEIRTYHLIHQEAKDRIWLMPAASSQEELIVNSKMVAEICIREGVNFSSRLQVAIWDKLTGV